MPDPGMQRTRFARRFGCSILASVSLREALASGSLGLRWSLPDAFEPTEEDERLMVARDPDRKVAWQLRVLPWRLDLRRSFDEELRGDLEADARHLFEEAFEPVEWPPGSGEMRSPRTADPRWSPIVDVEHVRLGEAPALRVVRRITYQPGNEVLSGALIVPLAEGFAELTAIARAGETGFRESVLMLKRPGGLPSGPDATFPSQAEYDDPAHDARFADHPLSLVRAALRWLLADAGLEVTAPAVEPPEGEHVVEAAGCAVVLPPRYLFLPREVMPMAPTLASFVRVGLGDAPMRLLDVWRLRDRLSGRDRGRALKRLAVETVEGWAEEGATDLDQETEIVAGDEPQAAVRTLVRFKVGDKPNVSAMRWRADEDGTVFRVNVSAPPYVPAPQLRDEADAVMASLRRLDVEEGGSGPGAWIKPWWKIW